MNTGLTHIADNMQEVLSGNPWYGQAMLPLLSTVDPACVYEKPYPGAHSMIEILYHMITWAEFTCKRLEGDQLMHGPVLEALDWQEINPAAHSWNSGVTQLTDTINKTIAFLKTAGDSLLEEPVDFRQYNFRFLLEGIIQHHIYHLAQIAYVNKLLLQSTKP